MSALGAVRSLLMLAATFGGSVARRLMRRVRKTDDATPWEKSKWFRLPSYNREGGEIRHRRTWDVCPLCGDGPCRRRGVAASVIAWPVGRSHWQHARLCTVPGCCSRKTREEALAAFSAVTNGLPRWQRV